MSMHWTYSFLTYLTLISYAVVCGGMLKVMKFAWRTHTRIPGVRRLKSSGLPKRSKIKALFGTLKRIMESGFPLLIVVKLRF